MTETATDSLTRISGTTLLMAIQAIHAEMNAIKQLVHGVIEDLDPDDQEILWAYSQAMSEIKPFYLQAQREDPGLPSYDELTRPEV